jgi:CDP-diacylglycerol---glycerol-3-phosphate 3-phosphatidyltransferase
MFDVVISFFNYLRANLSNDYFVNRQDRYIVISNARELCNFFENVIDSICFFSFKVNANGEVEYLNENLHQHPFLGNFDAFSQGLGEKIQNSIAEYKKSFSGVRKNKDPEKAYVYPTVQIYDCNIKLDQTITEKMLEKAESASHIYLSVGYFNLPTDYAEKIIYKSKANYDILLSSPEANGFYTANGFSSNIPKIYSYLEELFLNNLITSKQEARVRLNEYKRENWSI